MKEKTIASLEADALEKWSAGREEPGWLRQRRKKAWQVFEALPLPTTGDEEWRRTDIRGLRLGEMVVAANGSWQTAALSEAPESVWAGLVGFDRSQLASQASALLVNWGPEESYSHSDEKLARRGLIVSPLGRAARDCEELVARHYMTRAVPAEAGKFAALAGALWSAGSFVYVPEGLDIGAPIWVVNRFDGSSPGRARFTHNLVVAEEGSRAIIVIEEGAGAGAEQSLHSGITELYLKPGAQIRLATLRRWGDNFYDLSHHAAVSEADTTLEWTTVALGGGVSKLNLSVFLIGPGGNAQLSGLLFGEGRQHYDHHTWQEHLVGNTKSDLLFKSALTDQARSVFCGLIHVHKNAQKSDAYQRNPNLLLSDRAKADSIPTLEIEADDVRCTHGATVGRLDEEDLFYIMSRGLDRSEATRLVLEAFFEPVCARLPVPRLAQRVRDDIARKVRQ